MPSTRRSTRRQITPIPRLKKSQIAKASPAVKKSSPAGRITSSRASSKAETPLSVTETKQASPSTAPAHTQKRAYISDSDDEEIQLTRTPRKRRIQESDEENDELEKKENGEDAEEPAQTSQQNTSIKSSKSNSKSPPKTPSHQNLSVDSDNEDSRILPVRTRRFSARQSAKIKQEQKLEKTPRLTNKKIPKQWAEVIDSKFRRPTKIEKKEEKVEPHQISSTKSKTGDDEVEAEFGVVLLRPQPDTCLSRIQFHQRPLQPMNECHGRIKRQVKHFELTYKTKRNADGIAYNKVNALYDGTYISESSAKNELMLRQAVGFFKSDRFYILPVRETFEMTRQIVRPVDIDIIARNRSEDLNLSNVNAPPVLNPVRVRFARTETEWQRKRREQSYQYRQMLYEQDQWVDTKVNKEGIRTIYKKEISKVKGKAQMNKNRNVPLI